MSTAELVEHLKHMSDVERLAVIEAASQLIREGLYADHDPATIADDERIRAGALALKDVYDPGGDHTEWTALDSEDVLDESLPR